jgi:hypothetical protein
VRSAHRQFQIFTREEAIRFLATAPKMAENHGDRIAAYRRLRPTSTPEERARAHAYNERAALERLQKILRGEWPASYADGPIIVRAKP